MKLNDKYIEEIIKGHENLQRIMANRISDQDDTIGELMEEVAKLEEYNEDDTMGRDDGYTISERQLDNMIEYMRELIFKYKDKDADLTTHPFEVGFLDFLILLKTRKEK